MAGRRTAGGDCITNKSNRPIIRVMHPRPKAMLVGVLQDIRFVCLSRNEAITQLCEPHFVDDWPSNHAAADKWY